MVFASLFRVNSRDSRAPKNIGYLRNHLVAILARFWPWLAAICSGLSGTRSVLRRLIRPGSAGSRSRRSSPAVWFSGKESRHPWLRESCARLRRRAGIFLERRFLWLATVTVLGWFVLQFYMAIYFALWAWFCGSSDHENQRQSRTSKWDQMLARLAARSSWRDRHGRNRRQSAPRVSPRCCAWTTHEWVRGWVFSGWGWNGLGVALHGTLAAYSNRRVHRCRRLIVRGRVCERDRCSQRRPFDS